MSIAMESFAFEPFVTPTTITICGPTGVGKTAFVKRMIEQRSYLFPVNPPSHFMYCYAIHQAIFDEIEETIPVATFHQGLPSEDQVDKFGSSGQHKVIILDDLMRGGGERPRCRIAFHPKISSLKHNCNFHHSKRIHKRFANNEFEQSLHNIV